MVIWSFQQCDIPFDILYTLDLSKEEIVFKKAMYSCKCKNRDMYSYYVICITYGNTHLLVLLTISL